MNWTPVGLNLTVLLKCLEMTFVVIWRNINKAEFIWIEFYMIHYWSCRDHYLLFYFEIPVYFWFATTPTGSSFTCTQSNNFHMCLTFISSSSALLRDSNAPALFSWGFLILLLPTSSQLFDGSGPVLTFWLYSLLLVPKSGSVLSHFGGLLMWVVLMRIVLDVSELF